MRRAAFSLVELLVVIAVIALIATFAAPALNTVLQGTQLSRASQLLQNELALARQKALASNQDVEVRFYRFGDAGVPGENASDPSSGKYRAFQAFSYDDDGMARPIGKVQRLPESIVFDRGALSSLLESSRSKSWGSEVKPPLADVGTSYETRAFQFRPDGSTDLAPVGPHWFITLHAEKDGDNLAALPKNFATIRVDAVNGQNRLYRP